MRQLVILLLLPFIYSAQWNESDKSDLEVQGLHAQVKSVVTEGYFLLASGKEYTKGLPLHGIASHTTDRFDIYGRLSYSEWRNSDTVYRATERE